MARELDPITGLYYVRNRWYDPVMNRFVSEDPIGLEGGMNLYAYAANSPTNFRDPLGLDPTIEACVAKFIAEGATQVFAKTACDQGFALKPLTVTPWMFRTPRESGTSGRSPFRQVSASTDIFMGGAGPSPEPIVQMLTYAQTEWANQWAQCMHREIGNQLVQERRAELVWAILGAVTGAAVRGAQGQSRGRMASGAAGGAAVGFVGGYAKETIEVNHWAWQACEDSVGYPGPGNMTLSNPGNRLW